MPSFSNRKRELGKIQIKEKLRFIIDHTTKESIKTVERLVSNIDFFFLFNI